MGQKAAVGQFRSRTRQHVQVAASSTAAQSARVMQLSASLLPKQHLISSCRTPRHCLNHCLNHTHRTTMSAAVQHATGQQQGAVRLTR